MTFYMIGIRLVMKSQCYRLYSWIIDCQGKTIFYIFHDVI